MVKFYGKIGFGQITDKGDGNWEDVITERSYFGDVVRNKRQIVQGENVNSDITISNSIEVVADAYASENFVTIRYVEWMGRRWLVRDVEIRAPRLVLQLAGGVYNGPTPAASG